MEKFLVYGQDSLGKTLSLTLPSAKHYLEVKSTEEFGDKDYKAFNKVLLEAIKTHDNLGPRANHLWPGSVKLANTMSEFLSKHPFPLAQGPVKLPVDCLIDEEKAVADVIKEMTFFDHHEDQICAEWDPLPGANFAWGYQGLSYQVKDHRFSVHGAASSTSMGIVYTCSKLGCAIYCPCFVCKDKSDNCRSQCKAEICKNCSSQCIQHTVGLPRLFNQNTDQFTLVTRKMDKYLYAVPYTGIPIDCEKCSHDVVQHQVFHLVWHERCKFCKIEMRPFLYSFLPVLTFKDYKAAIQVGIEKDERTCTFCLKICKDNHARRTHEENVHSNKSKRFQCDDCEKDFTSKSALNYHKTACHFNSVSKLTCDLCGSQFLRKYELNRHTKSIHEISEENSEYECDQCNIKFTRKDNKYRHDQEQHFANNANVDYVSDLASLSTFECSQCDKIFRRESELKRHVNSVHNDNKFEHQCTQCSAKFSRKDSLNRHIKAKHVNP